MCKRGKPLSDMRGPPDVVAQSIRRVRGVGKRTLFLRTDVTREQIATQLTTVSG
jgi:hypothetical protein